MLDYIFEEIGAKIGECRMAIPKIVHYCWFGGKEKPDDVKKCIKSWKQHLSDYRFMEWNEKNFDINNLQYTKEAYHAKKYAFVSDVARIEALYQYGGIYMDTDVEVLKPFNSLLDAKCLLGMEEKEYVATSFMAFEKGHSLVKEFIDLYKNISFYDQNGKIIAGTNVEKLTKMLLKQGFVQQNYYQELENGIRIYPKEYFSPYDYINCCYEITENSYCVHHFAVSWMPKSEQLKKVIKKRLVKVLGKNKMNMLRDKIKK